MNKSHRILTHTRKRDVVARKFHVDLTFTLSANKLVLWSINEKGEENPQKCIGQGEFKFFFEYFMRFIGHNLETLKTE